MSPVLCVMLATGCAVCASAAPSEKGGSLVFESATGARLRFAGAMGQRIEANTANWLLPAPEANPGMIEMFRLRDRQPVPDLVPWAGEFVGKYLISAIQACRMSDDARLVPHVQRIVEELISTQAEDGYLGPFPKQERLLRHWDLWGHYHVMLALLMWHEQARDNDALAAARRAADLICTTYLDTDRRVYDAGSHEMNMAVIHAFGCLYRLTAEERYLRMMREIEADWERAGDYLRLGLAGVDFHRTPRPRWESLHDLQGLVELYRITGDERYKGAFVQHWTSIAQHDRHPSGAYSTNEQSVGNPYTPGAIETCCTTAWTALTVDMLRLTGHPWAADELELSTWNQVLGAQHPSGRWWTYNTPMDGARKASAHDIVFQARHGTPELNCCSVNGPRGLGVLSKWAVMVDEEGPIVNYYGPSEFQVPLGGRTKLRLVQETRYPAEGTVKIRVGLKRPTQANLRLRIPRWSKETRVHVHGKRVADVRPGTYLSLKRTWQDGNTIRLELDMSPRYHTGELQRMGTAVVYLGPILLAFDQRFNTMDAGDMPPLDLANLSLRPVSAEARFTPMLVVETTAADGRRMVLCDFATAGAHGTEYRAWLPAVGGRPAPFHLQRPPDGEQTTPGPPPFQ